MGMRNRAYILTLVVVLLALAACGATPGSIIIKEDLSGTGCEIEFSEWSEKNKCELSLNKKDELLVDVNCESGSVALSIHSRNGAEAYTGNGLDTATFTVKMPEEGDYVITITGEKATGFVTIKNLLPF